MFGAPKLKGRMPRYLSKCHIFGNHVSRLKFCCLHTVNMFPYHLFVDLGHISGYFFPTFFRVDGDRKRILGECLLISSLPGKAMRMLVDIARLAERFNMRSQSGAW